MLSMICTDGFGNQRFELRVNSSCNNPSKNRVPPLFATRASADRREQEEEDVRDGQRNTWTSWGSREANIFFDALFVPRRSLFEETYDTKLQPHVYSSTGLILAHLTVTIVLLSFHPGFWGSSSVKLTLNWLKSSTRCPCCFRRGRSLSRSTSFPECLTRCSWQSRRDTINYSRRRGGQEWWFFRDSLVPAPSTKISLSTARMYFVPSWFVSVKPRHPKPRHPRSLPSLQPSLLLKPSWLLVPLESCFLPFQFSVRGSAPHIEATKSRKRRVSYSKGVLQIPPWACMHACPQAFSACGRAQGVVSLPSPRPRRGAAEITHGRLGLGRVVLPCMGSIVASNLLVAVGILRDPSCRRWCFESHFRWVELRAGVAKQFRVHGGSRF